MVAAVVLGVVGLFAGSVIYYHYFHYAVVDGPQERALVAAIRARDVAAARAAIAAGATLTEPLPVVEETFESRRRGGREFRSALWVVIREMSAQTELARADRRKLEQLARVMFEAGGDPNAWVSMDRR